MEVLHIQDLPSKQYPNGKVLYAYPSHSAEEIKAFYFKNLKNRNNAFIENNAKDILDSLKPSATIEFSAEGWLTNIAVKKSLQRQKIGATLIDIATQQFKLAKIACVTQHDAYCYPLTAEAEHLIAYCLEHDIIEMEMCVFAHSTREILKEKDILDPSLDSVRIKSVYNAKYISSSSSAEEQNDENLSSGTASPTSEEEADAEPEFSALSSPSRVPTSQFAPPKTSGARNLERTFTSVQGIDPLRRC